MLARLAASICLAFAFASQAATYSINQIDYVDPVTHAVAAYTMLWGNNNEGVVIGQASMSDPTGGTGTFTFTYDPSTATFNPTPVPAGYTASEVGGISINDLNEITGSVFPLGAFEQGFLQSSGTFTFFTQPGFQGNEPRTLSDHTALHPQGLVVGFSYSVADPADPTSAVTGYNPYLYDPATATYFNIPVPPSDFTIAQGLNIAGQAVGHVRNIPGVPGPSGFLYTPSGPDPMAGGTVTTFRIHNFSTKARGINDHGILAAAVADVPGSSSIHTYVGTSLGFELVDVPQAVGPDCASGLAPTAFPEGLNNAGQITGGLTDNLGSCSQHGFIATPSSLPTGTTSDGAYTFDVDVVPDTPYFLDPAVAIGYDYQIGKKDPRFASVRLPLGIGDNKFVLVVKHKAYALNAGQLFDFVEHGFKRGVKAFRVACVDPSAMLDPVNSLAFPTEVTFATAGTFTGTQQPLTKMRFKGQNLAKLTQAQCIDYMLQASDAEGPDTD